MKNRLFPTKPSASVQALKVCQFGQDVCSSSAKSLVQLVNTFTQSGGGCSKKCLQLSLLLPLPSHKLHTFPKIHKKKKAGNTFEKDSWGLPMRAKSSKQCCPALCILDLSYNVKHHWSCRVGGCYGHLTASGSWHGGVDHEGRPRSRPWRTSRYCKSLPITFMIPEHKSLPIIQPFFAKISKP